jgi:hypothetical protein
MILLHKTMAEHEAKVSYQEIFHVQNGTFMVTENIDTQMNEALKNFFIKGNIAINHIFPLSKFMGCNISFIREKEDTKFEQNAAKFLSQVPAAKKLVEMLRKDRGTWFLCFLNFRDKIEHKSPQRLMVQYSLQGDKVYAQFPLIDDIGLVDLTQKLWQDLFTFIEHVIILLFRLKLPVQIKMVIIPEAQRDPLIPIKYAIALDISDVTQPERE